MTKMVMKIPKKLKPSPKRALYLSLAALIFTSSYLLWWHPSKVHAQTDTFTTSGTWTVPANVSSAVFEAWGGGGAGGQAAGNNSGSAGGAGGQYAKTTLSSLVTNNSYTVSVAAATAANAGSTAINGNDSQVLSPSSSIVVLAKGGAGGTFSTAGTGSTTGGVGDTVFAGGSGAPPNISIGGGGGGGAGSTGAGGNASSNTGGTGTPLNGGNGADGPGTGAKSPGSPGNNYGGAGSGAYKTTGSSQSGGAGAQGLVTVTYTVVANSSPNAPTLIAPTTGATNLSSNPTLQLSAIDPDGDSVKYKILLYSTTSNSGGNCTGTLSQTIDQTTVPSGWDFFGAYASGATASYENLSVGDGSGYCWQAQAIDPGGSNSFGALSPASTFTSSHAPGIPTLITPSVGATSVSTTPSFSFRTTDADSDYLEYEIVLYQSDCSTSVGSFFQTSSQTGWSGQDANGGLAYVGSPTLTSSTIATFTYQGTLTANTTYCWTARAIDPAGYDFYGAFATSQQFTTAAAAGVVNIQGGVDIRGGSTIQ